MSPPGSTILCTYLHLCLDKNRKEAQKVAIKRGIDDAVEILGKTAELKKLFMSVKH